MAFDLDGVLIESKAAVRAAYSRAGVVMPPDAWGKPASSWLVDPDGTIHARKNAEYADTLRSVGKENVEATRLLRTCMSEGHYIAVVTHASREAGAIAMEFLDLPVRLISTDDKYSALAELSEWGVYIDDNFVKVPPGWAFQQYWPNLTYERLEANGWTQ